MTALVGHRLVPPRRHLGPVAARRLVPVADTARPFHGQRRTAKTSGRFVAWAVATGVPGPDDGRPPGCAPVLRYLAGARLLRRQHGQAGRRHAVTTSLGRGAGDSTPGRTRWNGCRCRQAGCCRCATCPGPLTADELDTALNRPAPERIQWTPTGGGDRPGTGLSPACSTTAGCRVAELCGLNVERRRRGDRHDHGVGQGDSATPHPDRPAVSGGPQGVDRPRPQCLHRGPGAGRAAALEPPLPQPPRQTDQHSGRPPYLRGRSACTPTRCVTPPPPTSSRAVPTCG